jgi:hypothetical protein
MQYAELQVTSNFSFLRGASHGEELVVEARHLGLEAIAITDHNSLAGIVRAHVQAKETGLRFVVGARLDLSEVEGRSLLPPPPAPPHEGEGGSRHTDPLPPPSWGRVGVGGPLAQASPCSPGRPTGRLTGGCAGS